MVTNQFKKKKSPWDDLLKKNQESSTITNPTTPIQEKKIVTKTLDNGKQVSGTITDKGSFPTLVDRSQPDYNTKVQEGGVFQDVQSGRVKGAEIGGNTYLGGTSKDYDQMLLAQQAKQETPTAQALAQQKQQEILNPLEAQARQENQAMSDLISLQPQVDMVTRLSQAGFIPIAEGANFIRKLLGMDEISAEELTARANAEAEVGKAKGKLGGVGQAVSVGVGFLSTLSIKGISIANLFSGYEKSIDSLESESSSFVSRSGDIMTSVIKNGASVDDGIRDLQKIEEAIRVRAIDAQEALRKSPQDIKNGIDPTNNIYQDLNQVILRRQAMQRYQVTQNPTELQLMLNTQNLTNVQE